MMMDGLTPAEAAKIGLKPEEAAALRKAHAEMTATFRAAYPGQMMHQSQNARARKMKLL